MPRRVSTNFSERPKYLADVPKGVIMTDSDYIGEAVGQHDTCRASSDSEVSRVERQLLFGEREAAVCVECGNVLSALKRDMRHYGGA